MSDGILTRDEENASAPSGTALPWRAAPRTRACWPNWTGLEDEVRRQFRAEEDIAAEHGLSPVSFAIFELIRSGDVDAAPGAWAEQDLKDAALALEGVIKQHAGVVEWQSNPDVQRLMRRDIKRELRLSGNYGEPQLDELANRIVELAQHRRG